MNWRRALVVVSVLASLAAAKMSFRGRTASGGNESGNPLKTNVPIMLEWSPGPKPLWPVCTVGWKIYECPVLGGICVELARFTRCQATLQLDGTVSHLFFCTAFCRVDRESKKSPESDPSNLLMWQPPP